MQSAAVSEAALGRLHEGWGRFGAAGLRKELLALYWRIFRTLHPTDTLEAAAKKDRAVVESSPILRHVILLPSEAGKQTSNEGSLYADLACPRFITCIVLP